MVVATVSRGLRRATGAFRGRNLGRNATPRRSRGGFDAVAGDEDRGGEWVPGGPGRRLFFLSAHFYGEGQIIGNVCVGGPASGAD